MCFDKGEAGHGLLPKHGWRDDERRLVFVRAVSEPVNVRSSGHKFVTWQGNRSTSPDSLQFNALVTMDGACEYHSFRVGEESTRLGNHVSTKKSFSQIQYCNIYLLRATAREMYVFSISEVSNRLFDVGGSQKITKKSYQQLFIN